MARKSVRSKKKKSGKKMSLSLGPRSKAMIVFMLVVVFSGALVMAGRYFFLNNDLFVIKEVSVNKEVDNGFEAGERKIRSMFKGKNIFSADLDSAKKTIERGFPQLKKVEIRKAFPDRIEVYITARRPVAILENGRGMVIDNEAVVLSRGDRPKGVVSIRGITFFLKSPSVGQRINNKALGRALTLLKGIKQRMGSKDGDIKYIDVTERNNLVLGFKGVTVKMGVDDFGKKVDQLKRMNNDPKIDFNGINYIDLRFERPVISPK